MSTLSFLNQQTDIICKFFMKHLRENDVKKYLVARSQDRDVTKTRLNNLDYEETDL